MRQFKDFHENDDVLVENKIKDALKKQGITLKSSILTIISGMGAKELDYLVKAINAIRPIVEEKEDI